MIPEAAPLPRAHPSRLLVENSPRPVLAPLFPEAVRLSWSVDLNVLFLRQSLIFLSLRKLY